MKVGCGFKRPPHFGPISHAVGLCPRGLNGRSARAIQQTKLNAGAIDDASHNAAERIDLSNEMPFRDSTNRGVTRHLTDEIEIQCDQSGLSAETSRGRRGLATSMAGANHDYIEDLIERP
jgi:hypothetical protein